MIPTSILKNRLFQLVSTALVFLIIGHCSKKETVKTIEVVKIQEVEKKSTESSKKVSGTKSKITKPDGTVIETESEVSEDVFKTDYVKEFLDERWKVQEVNAPPRFFVGPAVSYKDTSEFGISMTYRFDCSLASASIYPLQKRAEGSYQVPLGGCK